VKGKIPHIAGNHGHSLSRDIPLSLLPDILSSLQINQSRYVYHHHDACNVLHPSFVNHHIVKHLNEPVYFAFTPFKTPMSGVCHRLWQMAGRKTAFIFLKNDILGG